MSSQMVGNIPQKDHKNVYVFLTVLFACLGSMTYGFSSAIIGTTLGQTSFVEYMKLDTASNAAQISGAMNALFQVGALFGNLSSGNTSDWVGRRRTIFYSCLFVIVGGALQCGSVASSMFMVARLITGVGVGSLVTIIPVWCAELAPPHSRGMLVGLHGSFLCGGYNIATWLGYGFSYVTNRNVQWRVPLALQIVPPLCLATGIWLIPESPRWLLQKGRDAEALATCKRLRRNPFDPADVFAQQEYTQMKAQYEYDRGQLATWASIFTVPSYRRRAILGFFCLFFTQTTGTQVINNYGPSIYASLGFDNHKSLLLSGCWILTGLPSTLLSIFLLDRFGRIKLMLFGLGGCCIALSGTCAMIALGNKTGNDTYLKAAVFFIFLHVSVYCFGLDPPSFVYGTEIWPNHMRAKGSAVSVSGLFVAALAILMAAPTAFAQIGWKYYLVFLILTIVAFFSLFFFFPEFNGMSLETTAELFGDHIESVAPSNTQDLVSEVYLGVESPSEEKYGKAQA